MQVALRHPELVERLVVVDISPVPGDTSSTVFEDLIAGLRKLDLATVTGRAEADETVAHYIPNNTIRRFLLTNLRRDESGRWGWSCNLDLIERDLGHVSDWPDPGPVTFEGPVLWIAGELSNYVRADYVPVMRGYFPTTQLVRVKNAGHWVHAEQTQVFTSVVDQFLS